mmetsp:Transcript_9306/g.26770  ORF Transcript_9306/g.26770 Transcript_9306/m.26770 type:complete len:314 (+) Transcript_9306:985-1926(+)
MLHEPLCEILDRHLAIAVLVERFKVVRPSGHALRGGHGSDGPEHCAFQRVALREVAHAPQHLGVEGLELLGVGDGARVGQPRVGQGRLGVKALRDIYPQQVAHEVLRLLRNVGPPVPREAVATLPDHQVRRPVISAGEGRPPVEQDVREDAQRPEIALLVVLLAQHLRRHVVQRAASVRHRAVAREHRRETEVDKLDAGILRVALEAEVLELQVAVAHTVPVAIGHGCRHLLHTSRGILLGVAALLRQMAEEVRPPHPLHHEAQPPWLLEDLKEAADVRMVHRQLVLHFADHLRHAALLEAFGRQRLHRDIRA